MKYRFSSTYKDSLVAAGLEAIERKAVWSSEDECFVVSVPCVKCGKEFLEEKEDARSKVVSGLEFVCLDCDKWGSSPAGISSVKMTIWFYA